MYDYELKQVEKKILKLAHRKVLQNKEIYLFGVSENTRQIIRILRTCGIEPVCVLDNDETRQGGCCSRIQVVSVDAVEDIAGAQKLYLIYSAYWREMESQLRECGVSEKNIYILCLNKKFFDHLGDAARGKFLYDSIIRKHGHVPVFVCPYTGTGDIYLIGTFWRQYIEANEIKDYVFMVISGACKKAAMLFDIRNVEVFRKKYHCTCLLAYYRLCPQTVNLKVLNDSWGQIHTMPVEWFRGYKGLDFMEMFRKFVFDLPDTVLPELPVLKNADKELEEIFREKELQTGNTVILSPYSNTLADLPDRFWIQLAGRLRDAGFVVCTNSSGEDEPEVCGTVPLFFPLNIAPQMIEKAGYFIGVRSGFCDIVSSAKAKKIILYDVQERFYNGSSYAYFSLKKMGLCEDVQEIMFEHGEDNLCDKVMAYI
nr:hypothetical protein [uncultured Schaedlerella sp.]